MLAPLSNVIHHGVRTNGPTRLSHNANGCRRTCSRATYPRNGTPGYGGGQSEKNYGQVIARRRDEVFLATKTDQRSYDGAMRQVESSLKRLQTDHVDLIQIHDVGGRDDVDAWGKPQGVLRALRELRDDMTLIVCRSDSPRGRSARAPRLRPAECPFATPWLDR